ncbi:MAG: hypothetical protein HDS26_06425 [Bacteroides sp.]|nr:hypothetical protein [Bacteroides sp.]
MMKRILIGFLCVIGVLYAECATVVPGRTWWYTGAFAESEPLISWVHPAVGLMLGSEHEYEEGWLPCYAVATWMEKLFESPLAMLKEEDGRVWIRPTMDLWEVTKGMYQDIGTPGYYEIKMLKLFLGYWNGTLIEGRFEDGIRFDYDGSSPLLLYDFNFTSGDEYSWPWSGINCEFGDNEKYVWVIGGCFVGDVEIITLPNGEETKSFQIYQEHKSPEMPYDERSGIIVEGVGITKGNFWSYVPEHYGQPGFWIAPLSKGYGTFTSMLNPEAPNLVSVIDADGSCVYGNSGFNPASLELVSGGNIPVEAIYDLQGRRVTTPERGIYIRGGRKILVR